MVLCCELSVQSSLLNIEFETQRYNFITTTPIAQMEMKTLLKQQPFFANGTERHEELLYCFVKKGVVKKVAMNSWRLLRSLAITAFKNNFVLDNFLN
jgi:hypothetical protein